MKINKSLLFIILLLLLFSKNSAAQNQFSFHHLSVEDGLSQSTVNCIFQDKQGFLWIGTNDGLNKYDGKKFTYYKYDPNDSNSISAPTILAITEAADGDLLIATDRGGLDIFKKITEGFTVYKKDESDSTSISSNRVSSITHFKGNTFLISTFGGGINFFDKSTGKFRRLKHIDGVKNSLSNNNVMKVIRSHDGLIWIATRFGLNILDPETMQFTLFLNDSTDKNSLPENHLQDVYEDRENRIWVSCLNSGAAEFDRINKQFIKHAGIEKDIVSGLNYINCYFEDSYQRLWIGTNGNGLNILDKKTGAITKLVSDADDANSINSNEIFSITEDKSGIIWIGTNSGGLNFYHLSFSYFNKYNNTIKKTFSNKNVYSFLADKNLLWAGTLGGGLYSLDLKTQSVKYYVNDSLNKQSLSDNNVLALTAKDSSTVWVGTFGGGINLFNKKNNSFKILAHDKTDSTTLSSKNIQCVFKDHENNIWVGTQFTGIDIFTNDGKKIANYHYAENDSTSLSSNSVICITEDDENNIWIGTQSGGLNLFNADTKKFKYYKHKQSDKFSLSNNDVFCIYPDKDILWIGTMGGGLNAFDKETGRFIYFTERNGLPNNSVYGILADKNGNLWLSTNKGICKFTPPKKLQFENSNVATLESKPIIRNFDMSDGISSNEFNQGAFCKDSEGNFYFGSINGITTFNPDAVIENSFLPPVAFTRFKIFEEDYKLDSGIQFKKEITLEYAQDFFSFEFAALNYLLPEKNKYAVMMEGFDKNWIYIDSRNYTSYTNLNPGNYFFKVKACNNDGVWNENYSSLKIIITPPFWMTLWFRILVAVAVAVAVYLVYYFRVRNIKREEQKKTRFNKALAEVEMKALRSQMNPHFIFNSLNSINKYIVTNDQRKASDYLARFSKLVRLVLENSMHQTVTLEKEMEALELYIQMERLRFEKQFDYKINITTDVDPENVLIPPLLLQPFVENSILHGLMPKQTSGKIEINISTVENQMHCIIEDNGIGREKAKEIKEASVAKHKSIGLKVTMDRIEILNQQKNKPCSVVITDLKNEFGNATGTRVELSIPLELVY